MFYDATTGERQRSISLPSSPRAYFINVRHQMFGADDRLGFRFVGSGDRPGAAAPARVQRRRSNGHQSRRQSPRLGKSLPSASGDSRAS